MKRGRSRLVLMFLFLACVVVVACVYLFTKPRGETSVGSPEKTARERVTTASEQPSTVQTQETEKGLEERAAKIPRAQEDQTSPTAPADRRRVAIVMGQCAEFRSKPSPEAVAALASFLDDESKVVVTRAIDTLGVIAQDPNYREGILKILKERAGDKGFSQRGRALVTATLIGKEEMLPTISQYIENNQSDPAVRNEDYKYAIGALSMIGSSECFPYVKSLLTKDVDATIKGYCFMTLAKIGTPEAVAILEKNSFSPKKEDQLNSVMALATLNSPEVNASLAKGIQNNRFDKTTVLGLTNSPSAQDIFGQLLISNKTATELKIELIDSLSAYVMSRSAPERENIKAAVAPLLESNDLEIRRHAIKAIGQVADEGASDMLLPYLYSQRPEIREEAFFAYVARTTPDNYTPLRDFLWDDNENIRRTAMVYFERFAGSSDRETLEKAAQHEDPFIREHAKKLLAKLS